MDTVVSVYLPRPPSEDETRDRIQRAFSWFAYVERICSRFEPDSEITKLAARAGVPVKVSPTLFAAVRFAVEVARRTHGAFDPTIGSLMERRGFNRSYLSGRRRLSLIASTRKVTYRDLRLDPNAGTVSLRRPLILDLGAVAKGMAIDLAAKELDGIAGYAIDAGGDVYVSGLNSTSEPWRVGVQHPRQTHGSCVLRVSDAAICTSGDYARPGPTAGEHHLIDARTGRSPTDVVSATVMAPTAMAADALATAAFVLGPRHGLRLLEREGVDGMLVTRTLAQHATPGFERHRA